MQGLEYHGVVDDSDEDEDDDDGDGRDTDYIPDGEYRWWLQRID